MPEISENAGDFVLTWTPGGGGCTDLLLGIFRLKNGARMGQGEDMLERKKEKKGIRYEG